MEKNNYQSAPILWSPLKLAQHLGVRNISIYRWIKQGKVKAIKVGSLVKIPQSEVDRIMVEGTLPKKETQ